MSTLILQVQSAKESLSIGFFSGMKVPEFFFAVFMTYSNYSKSADLYPPWGLAAVFRGFIIQL
jgi:hypothetical protein